MGDENMCEIVGIISVQIKTHDGMIRTLKNVRHTRDEKNLISLSTLDKEGLKYTGSGVVVKISKGSLVCLLGDLNPSNLYVCWSST